MGNFANSAAAEASTAMAALSFEDDYHTWRDELVEMARVRREYQKIHGCPPSKYLENLPMGLGAAPKATTSAPPAPAAPSDLDDQLAAFIRSMTIVPEDKEYKNRTIFIDQLREVLRREFPNSEIQVFGSFLTGLSEKESDIDIHADLGNRKNRNGCQDYQRDREVDSLYQATEVLHKSGIYTNFQEITATRIPIIKFQHKTLGVNCDLSFSSLLSTQNSKLIRLYTQIDPRIGTIMRIVRYWGKFHDFCGSLKIKTYALNLMVIFFFMQQKYVPNVHQLQTLNATALNRLGIPTLDEDGELLIPEGGTGLKIWGWNAGFLENPELVKQFMAKSGFQLQAEAGRDSAIEILTILQEFMEFFANFDYYNDMICCLTGEVLPKWKFRPSLAEELPSAFRPYFVKVRSHFRDPSMSFRGESSWSDLDLRPQALCVQDPFILNFNVGLRTKVEDVENWQYACWRTAIAINYLLENGGRLQDIFFGINFASELGSEGDREAKRGLKLYEATELRREAVRAFRAKKDAGEEEKEVVVIRDSNWAAEAEEVGNEEAGAGDGEGGSRERDDDQCSVV